MYKHRQCCLSLYPNAVGYTGATGDRKMKSENERLKEVEGRYIVEPSSGDFFLNRGGRHGEREARAYNEGLWAEPHRGPGAEPLIRVRWGVAP